MTATKNTPLTLAISKFNDFPVLAATKIYQGSFVGLNLANGYVRPLVAGDLFVGHCDAEADNSAGANGAISVKTYAGKYRLEVTLTGVAITDTNKSVFASDDNTLSLTPTASRVGKVSKYVSANTAVIEFEAQADVLPLVPELDCETGEDAADHLLVPGFMNRTGLLVLGVFGRVTEQFAGSSQDQGIVTVYDEDDNVIATLTPSNAAADAVGDIVVGYSAYAASTGAAGKSVAAGKYIDCKVTQVTAGGTPAGKMTVHIIVAPLA